MNQTTKIENGIIEMFFNDNYNNNFINGTYELTTNKYLEGNKIKNIGKCLVDSYQLTELTSIYSKWSIELNSRYENSYDLDCLNSAWIKVQDKILDPDHTIENMGAYFKSSYLNAIKNESKARTSKQQLSLSTVTDIDGTATLDERLSKHYTDKLDIVRHKALHFEILNELRNKTQKKIFKLFYIAGLTPKEICNQENMKQTSVSRSIKAIDKKLKSMKNKLDLANRLNKNLVSDSSIDFALSTNGMIDKNFASTRHGETGGKYSEPKTDYTLKGRENMARLSVDGRKQLDHVFNWSSVSQPVFDLDNFSLSGFKKTVVQAMPIDCYWFNGNTKSEPKTITLENGNLIYTTNKPIASHYIIEKDVFKFERCHTPETDNIIATYEKWNKRTMASWGYCHKFNNAKIEVRKIKPFKENRQLNLYRNNQKAINQYTLNSSNELIKDNYHYSYTRPGINKHYIIGSYSVYMPIVMNEIRAKEKRSITVETKNGRKIIETDLVSKQENIKTVPYQKVVLVFDKIVKGKVKNKTVYKPVNRLHGISINS